MFLGAQEAPALHLALPRVHCMHSCSRLVDSHTVLVDSCWMQNRCFLHSCLGHRDGDDYAVADMVTCLQRLKCCLGCLWKILTFSQKVTLQMRLCYVTCCKLLCTANCFAQPAEHHAMCTCVISGSLMVPCRSILWHMVVLYCLLHTMHPKACGH